MKICYMIVVISLTKYCKSFTFVFLVGFFLFSSEKRKTNSWWYILFKIFMQYTENINCLLLTFSFTVEISFVLSSPAYNKWTDQAGKKWVEARCWMLLCLTITLTMTSNSLFILSDVCWKVKRQSRNINQHLFLCLVGEIDCTNLNCWHILLRLLTR